jgi:hypothetical protein
MQTLVTGWLDGFYMGPDVFAELFFVVGGSCSPTTVHQDAV